MARATFAAARALLYSKARMDEGARLAAPRRRTLLVAAIACYALAAAFVAWRGAAVDYPVYVVASAGFLRGEDVYAWSAPERLRAGEALGIEGHELTYIYPPLTALVAAPLTALPYRLGLFLWSLLNGAAAIGSGLLLGRLAADGGRRRAVEGGTFFFVPFAVSLYAGQVNPLVALLAAAAVLALARGHDVAAGAALGASLLMKPLAIGVLLYAIWRGRWRCVAAVVVSIAVLLLACVLVFGATALGFLDAVAESAARSYPPSQNLPGLALRWSGEGGAATIAAVALCAGVAMATALAAWPRGGSRGWSAAELACVVAAVLLVNPRTWYHHYAILALAFALLLSRSSPSSVAGTAALAIAYAMVQAFGLGWHWLAANPFGARAAGLVAVESATIGAAIVWAVALLEARRDRRQPSPDQPRGVSADGVIVNGRQ